MNAFWKWFRVGFRRMLRGLVSSVFLATAALAQSKTPIELVQAGAYDQARAAMHLIVGNAPEAALHAAYLEALILLQQGKVAQSEQVFREILRVAPDFLPARRGLMQVLARQGQKDAALFHAQQYLNVASDTPERAMIAAATQSASGAQWGFSPRFSIVPSSNANKGAKDRIVVIGSSTFVLTEPSVETRAVGVSFGGTLWRNFRPSEQWQATGLLSFDAKYFGRAYIADDLNLGTELRLKRDFGHLRLSFGPRAERLMQEGGTVRNRVGFVLSAQRAQSAQMGFNLDAGYFRQTYPDGISGPSFRDGHTAHMTPQIAWAGKSGLRFSIGLPLITERTQRAHLDHDDIGLSLSVAKTWEDTAFVRLDIGLTAKSFVGNYPTLTQPRQDLERRVGVQATLMRLDIMGLTPVVGYSFAQNRSNVGLNSYVSHDFSLSFSKSF